MVTHRTANVQVVNDTGELIDYVRVIHKYSDNYCNTECWTKLAPGTASSPMQVDYHTGAFTTGRDWWFIAWRCSTDSKTWYYTNPHNWRGFVELLENFGQPDAQRYLQDWSTEGFKQHILRAEDALTKIHLTKNEVSWVSPSGVSKTGVAQRVLEQGWQPWVPHPGL